MSSNQVLDNLPWLQPRAIDWIQQYLMRRTAAVFEWGAGGSTLWFARYADHVISVEHDPFWHIEVVTALQAQGSRNAVVAWVSEFGPYAEFIHNCSKLFDLILVDGIARNECIRNAIDHLQPGGMLVVDNTERITEYEEGIELLRDWHRQDFTGDWTTSLFIKP